MKVLVTGATGFIGSHVVRELLRRDHTVDVLVRPAARFDRLRDEIGRIAVWPVDLLDGPQVDSVVASIGADAAIHLAWYAEPGSYLRDVPRNLASLEAGIRLLRSLAAGSSRRLVLAGTCLESLFHDGDEPVYGAAKRALHDVAASLACPGLNVACAHIFSVFGPGEDPRRAVPAVARALLEGRSVDLGAGARLRDYVFVVDVAAALVTVLESEVVGGIDICSGEPRPLRQVFEQVGRAAAAGHLLRFGARPVVADEDYDAVGDPTALRALGWRPGDSFAGRIDETVAWWRARLRQPAAAG
ncbi:MAG: hypothetical protein QOG43_1901 [Actinomycetota bacterium]|nr:hypothetical protein [Actinomycetota bacterium]